LFDRRPLSSENVPIQFQRPSKATAENLATFRLASLESPPEFRRGNFTLPDGGSPSKWSLKWRLTPDSQGCGYNGPKQKITIPDSVMRKLHEEKLLNAKKNARKNATE
jgi:hypothetical protein